MRRFLLLATVVCLTVVGTLSAASRELGQGFLDHGVATPISCHRGTVATVDGRGRPVVLSWLMDHRGAYELMLVDVETGKAEEYPTPFPLGDSPFASLLSSANKYYTHFGSHFVEFDPTCRAFTFCRKTSPQMAMSMTEDNRGVIWSATYPQSGVVSFDPKSRELKDYGHVYRQDWAQYPRSVAADNAGWIYLGIGSTACQVLAFDPKSGKASPLVPEDQRRHGSGYVYPGTDGKVYGQPNSSEQGNWHVYYQGQAERLAKRPATPAKNIITGSQGLFHDVFPDGSRLTRFDLLERVLVVEAAQSKRRKSVRFDYRSEGAHIMGVAAAPDGTVCGGTSFPMRFFSYDPRKDQWVNREAFGQWNTVARQGDRFFAGSYGGGRLLEWDPAARWVDTVPGKKESNPLFLAESAPTINRPHKLLAHPDGRTLVLAGTPGYGYTGGGLLFWDRKTHKQELLTHQQLIPEHSTMSLVALEGGKLLGGTTTAPGTGGQRKARQAELYLLDLATRRVEWHEAVLPGVQNYTDLCLGPGGLVCGFADRSRLFVFDPIKRKVVHQEATLERFGPTVSQQGPRVFVRGAKQEIFVLFARAVAQLETDRWQIRPLAPSPVTITAGGDFLDGRIYFAGGSHLYSYRVGE